MSRKLETLDSPGGCTECVAGARPCARVRSDEDDKDRRQWPATEFDEVTNRASAAIDRVTQRLELYEADQRRADEADARTQAMIDAQKRSDKRASKTRSRPTASERQPRRPTNYPRRFTSTFCARCRRCFRRATTGSERNVEHDGRRFRAHPDEPLGGRRVRSAVPRCWCAAGRNAARVDARQASLWNATGSTT